MGKSKAAKKSKNPKIPTAVYEAELFRLQTEFVKLQEWTRHTGARIAVVFEGARRGGQGRHHQTHHRVPESSGREDRRPACAQRHRTWAVVLPALRCRAARQG